MIRGHAPLVIASVAFRNFKALRSTRLDLQPFNLVLGPNGSGKTSLIEAVQRLRTLSKLPLLDPTLAQERQTASGPEVKFTFSPPSEGITARMGCVSEFVCDTLAIEPPDSPQWPELKERIGHIRSFVFDHRAMAEPSPLIENNELADDGARLAAVLASLAQTAPPEFAAFKAEAMRLTAEFSDIDVKVSADGVASLGLILKDENRRIDARELSQGILYVLGFLTLAFMPSPGSIVCIEEIDRGIHPRLLREVRDTLYRLSHPAAFGWQRASVQVIATTHSPYLLDLFRDHPEEVVISQKRGRAAHFERLSERKDLDEFLREGTLGDLWFSGVLGGVPEKE